jgi:hypothetical protein
MTGPVDLTRENNLVSWSRQGITLEGALEAVSTAEAAAAKAAASALEAQAAAAGAQSTNDLGATALAFVMCPAGVTPDRPSARTDIAYIWFSPSPPSTAAGKMLPGTDFWCVLDI